MNNVMNERQSAERATPPRPTYERLERLIAITDSHNVQVVIVALPVPDEYDVDPGLVELASKREIQMIDARHIDGIENEMFPDGPHMNSIAAEHFSHDVGAKLAPGIRPRRERPRDLSRRQTTSVAVLN